MMRTTPALQKAEFGMIVLDEVHKLKGGANPNGPTGTWKSLRNYMWADDMEHDKSGEGLNDKAKVDFILMLSGTPMVNRVAELWAYLHVFDPHQFDSLKNFERAFDAYVEFGGKVQTGKILDMCLKDRMVRRTRDEVGLELPEFNLEYRMVEYTEQQQKIYNQMRDRFLVWLDEQETEALTATAVIAQLTRLRQISVWPVFKQTSINPQTGMEETIEVNVRDSAKIDEAMDIIEEANDQVVVFCNFNEPFNEIAKRCAELNLTCRLITGATKNQMNELEVDFQNGEIDVLCINSSMGEGLNLQKNPERWKGGASVAIHLDRWWNPARDEQCNARIHRQGSKHPVFVYMIHSPNSVDDFVKALSDEKAEIFEGIMTDQRIRPAFEWKEELAKIL
jgi:SNF2 family DNA or RNA helicase